MLGIQEGLFTLFIGFYLSSSLLFQSLRKIGFGKQVLYLIFLTSYDQDHIVAQPL